MVNEWMDESKTIVDRWISVSACYHLQYRTLIPWFLTHGLRLSKHICMTIYLGIYVQQATAFFSSCWNMERQLQSTIPHLSVHLLNAFLPWASTNLCLSTRLISSLPTQWRNEAIDKGIVLRCTFSSCWERMCGIMTLYTHLWLLYMTFTDTLRLTGAVLR